jgi:hypothetical protein
MTDKVRILGVDYDDEYKAAMINCRAENKN